MPDAASPAPPRPDAALAFPLALCALVLGATAMGISPVFVREAGVGPFASAFWRVALALPLLLAWAVLEGRGRSGTWRDAFGIDRSVLLAGLAFAGDLFFWHLAILNTTIANATFLSCLAPVWVVLLSGWLIGEPVGREAFVGLLLCLAGAALLIGLNLAASPERLLGDLYGVATSLFFGLYFLAVRFARRRHGAGALTFKATLVTAAVLLAVTLVAGGALWPDAPEEVAALFALGLVSHSGGQGLLAVALGSLSAAFSSLVIFMEAVAAALFGWLFADEPVSVPQLGGGALILCGIWVARPRRTSPAHPRDGAPMSE